jgi:aryl-alcohol dehydrogenase
MAARAAGSTVIIGIDRVTSRRSLALEVGATHVIDPDSEDVLGTITEISGGGVDYSLDTTGNVDVIRIAVDVLGPLGVCGIIGASRLGTELTLDLNQVFFGRTVRGIIEGDSVPQQFIPALLKLHACGMFPFEMLLQFYELSDINQAMADSESGRAVKPVVRMTGYSRRS